MNGAGETRGGVGADPAEAVDSHSQVAGGATSSDPANDWLCGWCLNRVANERDRRLDGGRSEFVFTDPAGVRFELLLFSRTSGCACVGVPTLEHTWFPGHAWAYCVCGRCRFHLGWQYVGATEFAGLIRDRIVRAVAMLN